MKIKICGITHEKEIEYLNILKPDYIGFVFTKSKREIDPYYAEFLRRKLNSQIKSVGVFRDNSLKEVNDILNIVKLDVIQFHGNESFDFISKFKNSHKYIEIWKALSIENRDLLNEFVSYYIKMKDKGVIHNLLIDGSNPGSGKEYSIEPLKEIVKKESGSYGRNNFKFILAGGIRPENVLEKIKEATPWAIDVSSGVEEIDSTLGRIKSFNKINDLINKIKEGRC